MKPIIAITMGDPAGIGPEIVIKALKSRRVLSVADPVVVADYGVMARAAKRLKTRLVKSRIRTITAAEPLRPVDSAPAKPTRAGALSMIASIEEALRLTLTGEAGAMVTAPICKESAARAGFRFPGHTEFIAHLTGTSDFKMMLGGPDLKVVLVTIHTPLKDVARQITREAVFKSIKITDSAFKKYFTKKPRIAVAGLNPHAGEGGLFGDEELKVIAPAVRKAVKLGIDAVGPIAPDTVFYRAAVKKEFDCVVAMYHDQALGPLKLIHFADGVNTTLGLPIIRTSVDHGTAYDIAGKGVASAESMIAAIVAAAEMTRKRKL